MIYDFKSSRSVQAITSLFIVELGPNDLQRGAVELDTYDPNWLRLSSSAWLNGDKERHNS